MADLRQWWSHFSRPCPYGRRTLAGAALGALAVGCLLLALHLAFQGWRNTVALFPEPVGRAAHWLGSLAGSSSDDAAVAPWRRSPGPVGAFSFTETARTWRAATETFVRAPLHDDALPYSESPHAPLSEAIRQVDYALVQTLLRLDMDWKSLHLISQERRPDPQGRGQYLFQRIRIYQPSTANGPDAENLAGHLKRVVSIWCERATLEQLSPWRINIAVDGQPTHELFISPWSCPLPAVPPDQTPRLTVVIDDLGANPEAARELLGLGLPLTFSIWPRAAHAAQVAEAAWRAGQEVLIHQPCEPRGYPARQPGPGAVFVNMSPEEIRAVFRENVRRVPHAVGFNNHMGSRVTADEKASRALCEAAAQSGLFVLDSVTHPSSILARTAAGMGLTAYRRAVFLDDPLSPQAIRAALHAAERLARSRGQAIVIGHPHPATIAALREWSAKRDTSIRLVPLRLQQPVDRP